VVGSNSAGGAVGEAVTGVSVIAGRGEIAGTAAETVTEEVEEEEEEDIRTGMAVTAGMTGAIGKEDTMEVEAAIGKEGTMEVAVEVADTMMQRVGVVSGGSSGNAARTMTTTKCLLPPVRLVNSFDLIA